MPFIRIFITENFVEYPISQFIILSLHRETFRWIFQIINTDAVYCIEETVHICPVSNLMYVIPINSRSICKDESTPVKYMAKRDVHSSKIARHVPEQMNGIELYRRDV